MAKAKGITFNFGANVKPRKRTAARGKKGKSRGGRRGGSFGPADDTPAPHLRAAAANRRLAALREAKDVLKYRPRPNESASPQA